MVSMSTSRRTERLADGRSIRPVREGVDPSERRREVTALKGADEPEDGITLVLATKLDQLVGGEDDTGTQGDGVDDLQGNSPVHGRDTRACRSRIAATAGALESG